MGSWSRRGNLLIFVAAAVLCLLAVYLQASAGFDYWFQSLFFDESSRTWALDPISDQFKYWLYTVPKRALIFTSLLLIFVHGRKNHAQKWTDILAFSVCIAAIPGVVGLLKLHTQIHCPYDLIDFNGIVPFRALGSAGADADFLAEYRSGRCFPAGHASGGFAFMACYFVLPPRYKRLAIGIGFSLGLCLGMYQLARGAHFFSHTLFTFGFSAAVISVVDYIWARPKST